jgi:hypothetical protein
VDGDFVESIGDIAEWFGLGEVVKRVVRGAGAYASGRATQASGDGEQAAPYVYERVLTRRRELNVNDR